MPRDSARASAAVHGTVRVGEAAPLFAALGDETRLRLVARLAKTGPGSIARLSENAEVTRQAITKHLEILSDVGLVTSHKAGRERVWQLEPDRLADAHAHLDAISKQWDIALDRLKHLVEDD